VHRPGGDQYAGKCHAYPCYVFDHHHNERVVMVYNETTIFYLYPSYGRDWYENVEMQR
jgi:3-methyladenine DNA glycosylase Mpg